MIIDIELCVRISNRWVSERLIDTDRRRSEVAYVQCAQEANSKHPICLFFAWLKLSRCQISAHFIWTILSIEGLNDALREPSWSGATYSF